MFQDNPPACNQTLPSGHTVGIVQATGNSDGCAQPVPGPRGGMGRGGAQPLLFMTYGTEHHRRAGCNGDVACNFGYQAALVGLPLRTSQQG